MEKDSDIVIVYVTKCNGNIYIGTSVPSEMFPYKSLPTTMRRDKAKNISRVQKEYANISLELQEIYNDTNKKIYDALPFWKKLFYK